MKKKATASQDNLKGNISKSSLGILNTLKEDIMTSIMSENDEKNISVEDQENKYSKDQNGKVVKEQKSKKVKHENSNSEKEENCKRNNISQNNTVREYESKGVKDKFGKRETYPTQVQNEVDVDEKTKANNLKSEEENNEKVKVKSSKKRKRSKRSFMLDDMVIQRLNLLKLCMSNKDLSTIVEDAVNQYFDSNKDSIDKIFDLYDKVK